jgi:hypothetical protein
MPRSAGGTPTLPGNRKICPSHAMILVTKLQLCNALVPEALLRPPTTRRTAPSVRCANEAELRRQVRVQAGAWTRGERGKIPQNLPFTRQRHFASLHP